MQDVSEVGAAGFFNIPASRAIAVPFPRLLREGGQRRTYREENLIEIANHPERGSTEVRSYALVKVSRRDFSNFAETTPVVVHVTKLRTTAIMRFGVSDRSEGI